MGLFTSIDWLRRENNRGYGSSPIPNDRDREITSLIETWMKLDQNKRDDEGAWISEDQRFPLMTYSERMASLAVRTRDETRLVLGLVALGVDNWRFDLRDNLRVVSTFHDAASRIGISPETMFEKAAAVLPDRAATGLRKFLRRTAADRSIEAMDYTTEHAADGFRYKSKW
jgi:hypothetical protein